MVILPVSSSRAAWARVGYTITVYVNLPKLVVETRLWTDYLAGMDEDRVGRDRQCRDSPLLTTVQAPPSPALYSSTKRAIQ